MTEFLQALILGLLIGGVYALLASGLTLIFGVMNIINIAHGAFLILAAFITWSIWRAIGLDPLAAIVVVTPLMFAFGWVLYNATIRPIRRAPPAASVLLTFGLALFLEGIMGVIWGNTSHSVRPGYANESFEIGALFLPKAQVFGGLVAIVVLVSLYLVLTRSWLGRAIRASAVNPQGAELVGVNVASVAALTFAIGVASAGAGGRDRERAVPVPARLPLPVDRPPARHHRPGRHGQPAGRRDRGALPRRRRAHDRHLHRAGVGHRRSVRVRLHRAAPEAAGHPGHAPAPGRGHRMSDVGAAARGRGDAEGRRGAARALAVEGAALAVDGGDRGRRSSSSALFPVFSDDLYYQNMFILSMVFAIGAVGLNIITGYAGYVSLGQGAFVGLGAYTVGICVTDIGGSPWVWVPVAGVFSPARSRRCSASSRCAPAATAS